MNVAISARVLERVSTFTPLGIRFWDPLLDAQILDGLLVRAWPSQTTPPAPRTATRTTSGVYAFFNLPGTRELESGAIDPFGGAVSPAIEKRFIVDVRDTERRYVDVAFEVTLPLTERGPFPIQGAVASPEEPTPGLLLFSSPTRRRPSWFGAVYGELAFAPDGKRPAAHAHLAVTDPNGEVWHGVADDAGRFTVWLAYPVIEQLPVGSPQPTLGLPLLERTWPIRLEVFFQPSTQRVLPGTSTPDYESVLTQPSASVFTRTAVLGGTAEPFWSGEVGFGRDVSARTAGDTHLLVSPQTSSP